MCALLRKNKTDASRGKARSHVDAPHSQSALFACKPVHACSCACVQIDGSCKRSFRKGEKKKPQNARGTQLFMKSDHCFWADTVSHRSTACVPISSIGSSLRGMAPGFMEGQGAAACRLSAPIALLLPLVLLFSFRFSPSIPRSPGVPNASSALCSLASDPDRLSGSLSVCVCASP